MYKKGFTLIELLVVISIIGILSGIVVTGLNSARVSSRDSDRISDLKNIQLALAQYYNDNGHYPCKFDDVIAQSNTACQPQFWGNYMSVLPRDPDTNNYYAYTAMVRTSANPTNCNPGGVSFYHLGAAVENPGGSYMEQDDSYDMNISGQITVGGSTYTACDSPGAEYGFFDSDAGGDGTYRGCAPNNPDPDPGGLDPCYSVGPF